MKRAAVAFMAATLAACGDSAPETPPPDVAPRAERLRPLTSRDGGPPAAPGPAQTLPPGHPPLAADGASVSGRVAIAPALRERRGMALFIIARDAASGQIAAVRKEDGGRFPCDFRISGADAMAEGTPFAGPFDITARLSKAGDALPAPGDLEGIVKGVKAGARDVTITLDTVRQ